MKILPMIAEKCIEVAKTSRRGQTWQTCQQFPFTHFWQTWVLAGHIWQALCWSLRPSFTSFYGLIAFNNCYMWPSYQNGFVLYTICFEHPWIYFHSNIVRALFGFASLMLTFLILEIVGDKNFFLQCPIFFRVAFIYKYHDLRICQQHHNFSAIGKKRKLESVLTNLFDIAWCTVAIVLVLLLIKVFKHIVNYNGIVVYWALCTVFSYYAIHLVDFGYRLNAALMDIHVPASMLSPYLSRSVSEFWSRRWNLSVQSMLYDAFYRSIRDAFNAIEAF